jgi:hypothetical protein
VNSEGESCRKDAKAERSTKKGERVNGEWSIVNKFFADFAFFAPLRETSLLLPFPSFSQRFKHILRV